MLDNANPLVLIILGIILGVYVLPRVPVLNRLV